MRISKIEKKYNQLCIQMTSRVESAVEMYNIMLKLNTEQETMIFGGEHDQYQERYTSYEDAVKGHQIALNLIK
jgi:DNA-binding LacI/PurR family transcriptional regulator